MKEELEPWVRAYYNDVGYFQNNLSREEEYEAASKLREYRTRAVALTLQDPIGRTKLLEHCQQHLEANHVVTKLLNDTKKADKLRELIASHAIEPTSPHVHSEIQDLPFNMFMVLDCVTAKIRPVPRELDLILERVRELENQLVCGALMAARRVARSLWHENLGVELNDCIQEANRGLMQATRTYDPDRIGRTGQRVRFLTHAYTKAENFVRVYIRENSRLIRLPRNKMDEMILVIEAAKIVEDISDYAAVAEEANAIRERKKGRKLLPSETISEWEVEEALNNFDHNYISIDRNPDSGKNELRGRSRAVSETLPDQGKDTEAAAGALLEQRKLHLILREALTSKEFRLIELQFLSERIPEGAKRSPRKDLTERILRDEGTLEPKDRFSKIEASAFRKLRAHPTLSRLFENNSFEE